MGSPKLLLPWGEETVLSQLLKNLRHPRLAPAVVVCRQEDLPLQAEVRRCGAIAALPPSDPPEMRESVTFGVQQIQKWSAPGPDDGWLLIPADHPLLPPALMEELLANWDPASKDILIPTFEGKRGHPTLLRWELVSRLNEIPADRGINWLVRHPSVRVGEVPVSYPEILQDLDTRAQYTTLLAQHQRDSETSD